MIELDQALQFKSCHNGYQDQLLQICAILHKSFDLIGMMSFPAVWDLGPRIFFRKFRFKVLNFNPFSLKKHIPCTTQIIFFSRTIFTLFFCLDLQKTNIQNLIKEIWGLWTHYMVSMVGGPQNQSRMRSGLIVQIRRTSWRQGSGLRR